MNLLSAIAHFVLRCTRPGSAGVLRSLNAARNALGIPELDCLPAGHPRRMGACPVSRSLPGVVGVDGVAFAIPDQALAVAGVWRTSVELSPTGVYVAKLPRNVEQFVQDFDLGAYPEFEADSMALEPDSGASIVARVNASRRAA